jgi:hypothetical protein
LMLIKLNSLADIQHELLAPVQWAMNSTYHTTLQVTSTQLAFHCDMIMLMRYMAHWHSICQWHQAITECDNLCKNMCQVPHTYSVGDLVLIHQDTCEKLAKPTRGSYRLIDVAHQCQWYCHGWFESLSLNIQHLAIDSILILPKPLRTQSVIPHASPNHHLNTLTSGLLPHMLSLLENPLTFSTNTRHPWQCHHLSISTKKDCIFLHNTVVSIDVAPHIPVHHIIT